MLGESRTLNKKGKPKSTILCKLFGHKPVKGLITRCFNVVALTDKSLIEDAYKGWGCSRLGCGFDHSYLNPKADAILPKLLATIRRQEK